MQGLNIALSEITLVLFTTLAPSGTVALIIIAAMLVRDRFDTAAIARISQFLCIPLIITMVGLVASATHLGNPSNALYVFMGVGRSPLSNEVFCAVLFLGLTGSYWLYSFTRTRRKTLERIWLICIILSGIAFLDRVGMAYSVDTIVTWNSPLMPISLWLNALLGGPLLALLSLYAADGSCVSARLRATLCSMSAIALILNTAVLALYGSELAGLRNSMVQANDLVIYPLFICAFAALSGAGVIVEFATMRAQSASKDMRRQVLACTLVLTGIFTIRFAFYMLHMTVGMAV